MPANYIFQCLELRLILGSTDQFDAARRGFEVTDPEVELNLPPSSVSSVLTLFPKWLTSCLI